MEKLYKYNTDRKLKELFKKYDRDNFTLVAYEFIIKNIKGYRISQIDVIQICEMYTEMDYLEIFGEQKTTKEQEKKLFSQFKKDNKNVHIKRLSNGNYIYWHNEAIKELNRL